MSRADAARCSRCQESSGPRLTPASRPVSREAWGFPPRDRGIAIHVPRKQGGEVHPPRFFEKSGVLLDDRRPPCNSALLIFGAGRAGDSHTGVKPVGIKGVLRGGRTQQQHNYILCGWRVVVGICFCSALGAASTAAPAPWTTFFLEAFLRALFARFLRYFFSGV